ncbi:MAG: membrane protein insertase YidC [Flavobacteriales bacterium]|nr:membrane protein insertase YidC [Flavobacteriales bacterium]
MLQQEKKTDFNSIIGFALIGIVLFWFLNNQAGIEETQLQTTTEEVASSDETVSSAVSDATVASGSFESDSVVSVHLQEAYGAFANAAAKEDLSEKFYLENDLVKVELAAKGARVTSVFLKEYQTYDSLPLNLLREDSSRFNLTFWSQNRRLQTSDFVFETTESKFGDKQVLSMRLNVQEGKYLEFAYALEPNSYKVDYTVNLVGLDGLIQSQTPLELDWAVNIPRQELNRDNEAMNTSAYYFVDGEIDDLSATSDDSERVLDPDWIAFKSQYFSTVLSAKELSKEIELSTEAHPGSDRYLKTISASANLNYEGGSHSYAMEWYFVPNHVKTLKSYGIGLEGLVPLGWSIIGWINKYVVITIFNAFENWGFGYGMIILMMALLIKMALFPFTYKSYTSMAKMRVLKPQIDAINEKYEDKMKRQQETMALYKQTGVSPLGGCIPMLFQMPILFALFRFFPASIELRQQGFLWANDLSTYDSILDLGFNIPFYGDHVSLFTLLMTVTTVLQMKYSNSMSASNAQMPQMKYMIYFMPVIFLGVMNNYAAALSYYYFLANLITFGQQKIIERMTDDSALLAKMEEKKQKDPVKGKSKFQARLENMMKAQQEAKKRK